LIAFLSPFFKQWKQEEITFNEFIRLTRSFVSSCCEPILEQTLINNGRAQVDIPIILNQFWNLYEEKLGEQPEIGQFSVQYVFLILKKKINI